MAMRAARVVLKIEISSDVVGLKVFNGGLFGFREIYRLTEGLQRERATLLKQVDLLR